MTDNSNIRSADFSVHSLTRWEDLIGKETAKKTFSNIIQNHLVSQKIFLAGPSGSGKSALIEHLCATLACNNPDGNDPCGQCKGCQAFKPGHRNSGLFALANWEQLKPVHYLPFHCQSTPFAVIGGELENIRNIDGIRIIHLEEAAGLKKVQHDESIMQYMDDPDFAKCLWFASAVRDHELDEQLRRRWVKLPTSKPDDYDAACLLAKRCHASNIQVDKPSTLELLARRSWCVMGLALAVLELAILQGGKLTREMVLKYPFPKDDPWDQEFFKTS